MQIWSTLWNLLKQIPSIGQVLIAFFTGYIALVQYRESRYNKKIENMIKANDSLMAERSFYTRTARDLYNAQYGDAIDADAALVCRPEWLPQSEKDLLPLRDVTLKIADEGEVWVDDDAVRRRIQHRLLPDRSETFAWEVKFHLHKNLFSLPLFALADVDSTDGACCLTLRRGEYFDFYNTCEYPAFEMAYVRRIQKKNTLALSDLPLRHHQADLFDLTNRFAGIGIDTLTIFHNLPDESGAKHNYFLLHKRSSTAVAEGPGTYHCVPAGSFQPASETNHGDLSPYDEPEHTVLREFAEELMGMEECAELNTAELYDVLQIEEFAKHVYYLGIGFEPLNTKTELLCALILDMDDPDVKAASFLRECRTKQDVEKRLMVNYEGAVMLKPLTHAFVNQYARMSGATPSFRQIMQIVQKFPAFFGVDG
jgi:hypothetical protein